MPTPEGRRFLQPAMTITCSRCGQRIEGLLAYENHARECAKPRGELRANPLVGLIIGLAIGREITKED